VRTGATSEALVAPRLFLAFPEVSIQCHSSTSFIPLLLVACMLKMCCTSPNQVPIFALGNMTPLPPALPRTLSAKCFAAPRLPPLTTPLSAILIPRIEARPKSPRVAHSDLVRAQKLDSSILLRRCLSPRRPKKCSPTRSYALAAPPSALQQVPLWPTLRKSRLPRLASGPRRLHRTLSCCSTSIPLNIAAAPS